MAILERRTDLLSGCQYGEGFPVNGTAWNTPTVIHAMTVTGVIDAVFLQVWNKHNAAVDINLIINPDDSGVAADVADSTILRSVGAENSLWVLSGGRFRKHASGSSTYTIAAYVAAGDVDRIIFSGYFDRLVQAQVTP